MKISVNQLRLELADIEQGHLQLNTFFWGDFPRAVNEENINYPLMASYFPNAGFLDNQTTLPITIVIADKIYDDYTNLNDVESDTLQICRDVFNVMNKSTRWQLLGRVESCSLTKFIESNADVCAGYVMTVNFTLRDSNSICDLPMSGYDFDQVIGSSCLPVQIYRNGVLVDTVASGGTYSYTTDAFTYTIKNTALTTLYSGNITANLNVTIQDATVSNSDASYSASVLAEGSLVLPDITVDVTNSALTVVNTATVASVQDVIISAPDGTINIKKTGDGTISSQSVPSGATIDYSVADNAITVNSTNGFSIDATDPLDIVLTDGTSSVTPTSVTYSQGQHKVDIVLPASGTPIDADAQAFLTATGLSGVNEILAVNTFVTEAKAQGIWNDLDKIYPFIGGTSTTHRYNLKNALADGTFFGGVTHNSNGVTFNGTTGYFNTGWATNAGNLYNRHFSQYVVTQNSSTAWAGSYDGTNLFGLRTDQARVLDFVGLNSLYSISPIYLTRASIMCANIDSSTVGKVYSNGLLVFTNTGAINATPTTNTVYVGALNFNGTASFFHDSNVRFVTTGNKLDASKQAILNNLARYFNAILGR